MIVEKAISEVSSRETVAVISGEDGKRKFIVKVSAWRWICWMDYYMTPPSTFGISAYIAYDVIVKIRQLKSVHTASVAKECYSELYNGKPTFRNYMSCGGEVKSIVIKQRFLGYHFDEDGLFETSEGDESNRLAAWVRLSPRSIPGRQRNKRTRAKFVYDPAGSFRRTQVFLSIKDAIANYKLPLAEDKRPVLTGAKEE